MAHWAGNYLFGQPLQMAHDLESLQAGEAILNYSHSTLALPSVHMAPHGLLEQSHVQLQTTQTTQTADYPIFFAGEGAMGFDLLSAAFFLLSRYEEYLPHTNDAFGRYCHTNALAYRENFLHRPLIDEWMMGLKACLLRQFPGLVFAQRAATYTPTFDVDVAWSYAHKGLWRNTGGLVRQLLSGRFNAAANRVNVVLNGVRDPFDVYADLNGLHQRHGLKPKWFFLMAKKARGYDKNTNPRKPAYQQLMQQMAGKFAVGLHGSCQAAKHPTLLSAEQTLLQSIVQQPITTHRYHYLAFKLPGGYTQLCPHFKQDYSMGYGSINGFRASTCTPFFWYHLGAEQATGLQIFPFAFMEANSIFELKHDAETALAELQSLYNAVTRVEGLFITIFHNHLVGLDHFGRTWWNVYERFLVRNFPPQL
ncbi:MAG: hypothetical protein EAY75_09395 [Bacteroidetes bacterium]|nr:MAG: hypothetical protein EAY75_09395 [Bacteroidota bacterium]